MAYMISSRLVADGVSLSVRGPVLFFFQISHVSTFLTILSPTFYVYGKRKQTHNVLGVVFTTVTVQTATTHDCNK